MPRDPYDGGPMKLKPTDDGLVIYSVGPDMSDDGGIRFDDETEKGDISFQLLRARSASPSSEGD